MRKIMFAEHNRAQTNEATEGEAVVHLILNLTVTQSIPSTEKLGLEQCQTVIAWTVCL